jgi:membrane-associated phospholipid phosphatase
MPPLTDTKQATSGDFAGGTKELSRVRLYSVIREHTLLLTVMALHFVCAAVFLLATGQWTAWQIRWRGYPYLTLAFVIWSSFQLLVSRRSRQLEHLAGAALVLFVAAPFQSTFNSVKQVIDNVTGYRWDAHFAQLDKWMHFGRHPFEWLRVIPEHRNVLRLVDWTYMLWFPVVFGFVLWAAWSPERTLRRHALVSSVLVWALCGNAAALLMSSAGPCYYADVVVGHNPYAPLMMTLQAHHEQSFLFARVNQVGLWTAMQSNVWLPFGGISAMPSVHVAMTVLIALVGRERNPTAGMLLSVFALIILLGSVVLGWHYAIDGYAGAIMAYAIWRIVRKWA